MKGYSARLSKEICVCVVVLTLISTICAQPVQPPAENPTPGENGSSPPDPSAPPAGLLPTNRAETAQMLPPLQAEQAALCCDHYTLWDTVILSIFNKHAPEREWTPLYATTFFSDGWLQPYIAPPETTGGSLRQGWAGLNDVFFNRMIDSTLSSYRGSNGKQNQQVAAEDIETPISRRWMFGVITAYVDSFNGNGQPAATTYGDTIIENRFILHETRDLTITANVNFRVPTGSSSTGNDQTSFIGYLGWYKDLGFDGWSFRGLVGITDPLSGIDANRAVTFNQTFALGQTLTKHDVPWIGDFTYYVIANLNEAGNTNTFVSITPGFRTHLGRDWWLLLGLEVPVTANAGFSERVNLQIVKGF